MPKVGSNGLLPRQRHQIILDHLERDGRVLAAGLASELGVTEDMIRRDLRELSEAGSCQRVYGGAVPLSSESTPIVQRIAEYPEQKNALAKLAVSLVTPGQTIFVDGGSTNESIALCLPRNVGLTVVTNAPLIAAALIGRTDLTLLMIGGRVDSKFGAAVGASAVRDIQMIRADLCFLGVCAVDAAAGLGAFDPDEADVKRAFVRSSASVAIAVMNNKLGTRAPYCVASTSELSSLVVEHDAPASHVNELADAGVQILRLER